MKNIACRFSQIFYKETTFFYNRLEEETGINHKEHKEHEGGGGIRDGNPDKDLIGDCKLYGLAV